MVRHTLMLLQRTRQLQGGARWAFIAFYFFVRQEDICQRLGV